MFDDIQSLRDVVSHLTACAKICERKGKLTEGRTLRLVAERLVPDIEESERVSAKIIRLHPDKH